MTAPLNTPAARACSLFFVEKGMLRADGGQLYDIDPQAWLADVLARVAALPQGLLRELLPWSWSAHVRSVASRQAA